MTVAETEAAVSAIQKYVADYAGLTVETMLNGRRTAPIVWYRQVAVWIAWKLLKNEPEATMQLSRYTTWDQLGRLFNRDHGTVFHSVQVVNDKRSVYPKDRKEIDKLLEAVRCQLLVDKL